MNNYWLNRKQKAKSFSCKRAEDYAYQKGYLERYENTRSWLEEKVDEAYKWLLPAKRVQTLQYLEASFQKRVGSGFDQSLRNFVHCLALHGDLFLERVCDKNGKLIMVTILPPETVFRIQTTKGNLLEFQQSSSGPDYASIARGSIDRTKDGEWDREATAVRFKPEEIVHVRLGEINAGGYGTSLLAGCSSSRDVTSELVATILSQIERMTGD